MKRNPSINQSELLAAIEQAHALVNAGALREKPAGYFTSREYAAQIGGMSAAAAYSALEIMVAKGKLRKVTIRCPDSQGHVRTQVAYGANHK